MIAIKDFTARLGNQLFQLSNAIAYAERVGSEVAFPVWQYSNFFKGDFSPILDTDTRKKLWYESGFHYTPIPIGANLLGGYYQSEKYFMHIEGKIRSMLSFSDQVSREVSVRNSEILKRKEPKVSMHLRRGDYLNLPNHHPVVPLEYFEAAKNHFPDNSLFVVFSDDPEWCKNNFPAGNYMFIEGQTDIEDLCLMTMCDHNCIANSTFSWWGAWLNDNPDKIVVAPKRWFGPAYSHWSTSDLYCKDWIVI